MLFRSGTGDKDSVQRAARLIKFFRWIPQASVKGFYDPEIIQRFVSRLMTDYCPRYPWNAGYTPGLGRGLKFSDVTRVLEAAVDLLVAHVGNRGMISMRWFDGET